MLYQVVFSVLGACGSESKEVEAVTMNGHKLDGRFWQQVQAIIKRREKVHPVVNKWARMSACELKSSNLGLTVEVHKAVRHPYTQQVERCRGIYRNRS